MAQAPKRRYDNKLRSQRAEDTRTLILDAVAEQLADASLSELSVARIAARAGVSEPTVYRHFPNRDQLWKAFDVHIRDSLAMEWKPQGIAEWLDGIEGLFEKFDALAPFVIASFNAPIGREYRASARARRHKLMQPIYEELSCGLDETQARRAMVVFRYLFSSLSWKTLREDHGMQGSESADAVRWALEVLIAEVNQLKARNQRAKGKSS